MNIYGFVWPVIIIAGAGIAYWARRTSAPSERNEQPAVSAAINAIKENGIRIHVDYSKCTIKDRSYSYEKQVEHGRVAGMNVFSGDEMSNVRLTTKDQLLLEYPYTGNGSDEDIWYQIPIYGVDRASLDMRFIANDIYLYIDKQEQDKCLLDLGDCQMWGEQKL
jgi:hypothetical protein